MTEHSVAEEALLNVHDVFSTLSTGGHGESFLQARRNRSNIDEYTNTPNSFVQVGNHLKTAMTKLKTKHYQAIFTLLATITSKAPVQADQQIVETILDLIDTILANLRNSRSLLQSYEAAAVETYHATKDMYEDLIR